MAGHQQVVRLLLHGPASSAARGDSRESEALILAAQAGHLGVVRLLLKAPLGPARPNAQDQSALYEAAENGHMKLVHLLLCWPHHPINIEQLAANFLPLKAALYGDVSLLQLILKDDPHQVEPRIWENMFSLAAQGGHVETMKYILSKMPADGQGSEEADGKEEQPRPSYKFVETAILKATADGRKEAMRFLLSLEFLSGPGHLESLWSAAPQAVAVACRAGHADIVRMLLKQGCSFRAMSRAGKAPLETALVDASDGGHEQIVRLLLKWPHALAPRADCCDGQALLKAASNGHESVVR
jgi:hypothetical protein